MMYCDGGGGLMGIFMGAGLTVATGIGGLGSAGRGPG